MTARRVDLIGGAQVAALLGVTPGAVSNYARRGSWPEGFPEPAERRAGGAPLWRRADVAGYARTAAARRRRSFSRARVGPDARAVRDADIRARRAAGETLAAIGESHGLTRERVRQITVGIGQTFAEGGLPPR